MALTTLEERIVRAIGRNRLSISQIEDGFWTDRPVRRTLQRVLKEMVRKGLLNQTGVQRGTRYEKK